MNVHIPFTQSWIANVFAHLDFYFSCIHTRAITYVHIDTCTHVYDTHNFPPNELRLRTGWHALCTPNDFKVRNIL